MTRETGATNKTVTLALLAYNHESFIQQCIASLSAQTYRSFHVVFIDDGSTDRTFEFGRELLAEAGIDTVALQHRDAGIPRNLNAALTHAQGAFFCVLSCDDWLTPESLALRVNVLEGSAECALAYGPATLYYEADGRFVPMLKPFKAGFVYADLLQNNFIPASTALVRTHLLRHLGGFDETLLIEDWDMWLRIASRHEVAFIDTTLAYYRQHAHNFSRNEQAMRRTEIAILEKHRAHPAARRRLRRAKLRYGVDFEPPRAAFRALLRNGSVDWFTVRQCVKFFAGRTRA